jgi:NADH-quinone oxidoreductase subunit G
MDEIAGTQELGMLGRGDRSEISACLEKGLDSELSGNVIDLCPVGALTNKPFRFSARAWELMARPSLASHDGVVSNLWYHTRGGKVMRAVPRDCESANETWLADRDRYSHFGLGSDDRVTQPMIKADGRWSNVNWDEGIRAASRVLRSTVTAHGGDALGVLMSPSAATEEYFLAQRLARGLECGNIDHRLREQDFSDDAARSQPFAFTTPMEAIDDADVILLIGSNIRHEAPILGQRVRKAWRRGAKVSVLNPVDWGFHFIPAGNITSAPQDMINDLAGIALAIAELTGKALPGALQAAGEGAEAGETHKQIAAQLHAGGTGMLILGQAAMAHANAAWLRQLAAWVAEVTGSSLNMVPFGGNTSGAVLAGALPGAGVQTDAGLSARAMLESPRKGYLLWDLEPGFDVANPALARAALAGAEGVVAVAAFAGDDLKAVADVILPLAPLAESEGVFYALDGQSFSATAAVKPAGQARPGWKILRRLGGELELDGFSQVDIASLREEMLVAIGSAQFATGEAELAAPPGDDGLHRVGDVPMYAVDALCRRSEHLQQTVHGDNAYVGLSPGDAGSRGLEQGAEIKVTQGEASTVLPLRICPELPDGAVWVKSATSAGSVLGDSYGPISVEAV